MDIKFTFQPKKIDTIYDVVVVGGGLSGVMAAISSARENKSVLLIEKYGFLGGMATAGLISPFMNYCERNSNTPANGGLFRTLLDKMYEIGAIKTPSSRTFKEQLLKLVLDEMVQSAGVQVLFHSYMSDVNVTDGKINSVIISTVSGNIEIKGRCFIDTSGDANLTAFAGFEYYLGRENDNLCQPMTTCFNLINVEWERFDHYQANQLYKKFQSEGKIKNPRENILIFDSPIKDLMHFNTTRIIKKNPCDVQDVTQAEFIGREQSYEMFKFLKENVAGFENSELIAIADEVGIRESRRIVGLYQLTEDDLLQTKKFDDSIARGTYDIDIHNPNGAGTTIKHIPDNDYYTIPYRSMLPVNAKNLIVAGRNICMTHVAHSSVRVMPITSCIGEAAGIAAALAVESACDCKDVNVKLLQGKLQAYNALF